MINWKWENLTQEEKLKFVRDSVEASHKREYDAARSLYVDKSFPEWEDLTEEQRQNIRDENKRYHEEMQEFGNSLSQG